MDSQSNELVIYRNDLNLVSFKEFNPVEMDLFFAVCSQAKETKQLTVQMDLDKVRRITGQYEQSLDRFMNLVSDMNLKMSSTVMSRKTKDFIEGFSLFTYYRIDANELIVDVNPRFAYIINNIDSDFTRYELNEFTKIKSRYTKTLFRQLKQFKDTGMYIVSIDKFRYLFDIPDSYRMTDIDRQVLKPSIKELSDTFENLKVTKIKKGRTISQLKFTFKKQSHDSVDREELPTIPMYDWLRGRDVQ